MAENSRSKQFRTCEVGQNAVFGLNGCAENQNVIKLRGDFLNPT